MLLVLKTIRLGFELGQANTLIQKVALIPDSLLSSLNLARKKACKNVLKENLYHNILMRCFGMELYYHSLYK